MKAGLLIWWTFASELRTTVFQVALEKAKSGLQLGDDASRNYDIQIIQGRKHVDAGTIDFRPATPSW